ncbi:MAG: hypothetical protein KKB50_17930 [Planctomycetes bacterium]|nr:hypothetical protein [Planctomycetota bacterium]
MKGRIAVAGVSSLLVVAAVVLPLCGCTAELWDYLTEERAGNIAVTFVNDTPYRASFSFGTWDDLDRTPGATELYQLRLEGNTVSDVALLTCRRNMAIGTQAYLDRVLDVRANDTPSFDADAFSTVVHFSSAPADAADAALPTVGTGQGIEKLLGIDYSCESQLIFTFVADPDAVGGFRIDYALLRTGQ